MWRSLDSFDTRYRDFCCCSKAIFSSEKRVITILCFWFSVELLAQDSAFFRGIKFWTAFSTSGR